VKISVRTLIKKNILYLQIGSTYVGPSSRLREAIKQTEIATERMDDPETVESLEEGIKSLESALESFEDDDRD
jgi:hypothetical protein